MSELKNVIDVEKALVITNLVQATCDLEARNLYSEDLQELLNNYVIQLQKELNDYTNFYESASNKSG